MIHEVQVENYKSISSLTLGLGRVTVLIGANGSGKSNILEAIALGSAAAQNKLDNEFLISRGIRVTETRFMRSAFTKSSTHRKDSRGSASKDNNGAAAANPVIKDPIRLSFHIRGEGEFGCELSADESGSYPKWRHSRRLHVSEFLAFLKREGLPADMEVTPDIIGQAFMAKSGTLPGFLVFAPENSALRTFQAEGQILPLGIRGEGLFAHLKALTKTPPLMKRLAEIKKNLCLIEWFDGFDVPDDLGPGERSIRIRDRFLAPELFFDQRSANEGFLFLLFYITLFISPDTPAFFSIDNVDCSLNPKLCIAILQQIVHLAKEHDKQVILTTHSPAVLDGLDLHDEDQRLMVVDRNKAGHTRVRRVDPPKPVGDAPPVALSEAFMRGYIGGLPKNF
jgi:hypothetical protein